MKKFTLLFIIAFSYTVSANAQTINKLVKYGKENEKEKLLGVVNKKGLTQNSFNEWFSKNYDNYLINDKIIAKLKDSIQQYEIKAFFGTWCGDSKKELPPFYKIIEATGFPTKNLEVIAVDRESETYKQSPTREEKGLNIHRVPTFIFYKDGKEVNRIVEHPKETLERDILKIVTGQKYSSNYSVVNYIERLLKEKGLDSLQLQQKELIPLLAEYTKGSRELNTYGYVKLAAGQLDEALYIFDVNTQLFPYKHNVYDSLGEAFFEVENYTEALKNYYKVLAIKPEDENAPKMIKKINEKTKEE